MSEIVNRPLSNPAEALKLGQVVKAKIILLEPGERRIGLSIKALNQDSTGEASVERPRKTPATDRKPRKVVAENTEAQAE